MQERTKVQLSDVSKAIEEIGDFIPESYQFEDFKKNIKTKRAVERNIEIIGEAVNRILRVEPEIKISNARNIVDTRNRIIYEYDAVSDDILWLISVKYLPVLKEEVEQILNEKDENDDR